MDSSKTVVRTQGWNTAVLAVAAALAVNAGFGYALTSARTAGQRYLAANGGSIDCQVAYLGSLPMLHVSAPRLVEPAT
jgi:hypothetical protein